MQYIPCTIEIGHNFRIITVPVDAVGNAAGQISGLLTGTRKKIVFLDGKTEFVVTAGTAACNGRCVSITKNWLECLERLFTGDIRPGISHLDWEFSDQHIDITVRIGDMRYT